MRHAALRALLILSVILPAMGESPAAAEAAVEPYVSLLKHESASELVASTKTGVVVKDWSGRGVVRLAATGLRRGENTRLYGVSPYYYGTLVSRPQTPARPFDRAGVSWNAATPAGTWVQVELRAYRARDARWTPYYNLGIWALGTTHVKRRSVPGQRDADGRVATDTLELSGGAVWTKYQYRLTLFTVDRARTPAARMVAVVASASTREAAGLNLSTDRQAWGRELAVPMRSQMVYPDGGEVWCSPTSTAMVLGYWGRSVSVPRAAARTYDHAYEGTGNWPFNTAYAATLGLDAYVTRMGSLAQVEEWISAGVPVILSIAFEEGELPGAPVAWSNGHLIVVRGFTRDGDVIVNDPAGPSDARVRHVYDRAALQRAWRRWSGGTVYLIHPGDHALPTARRHGSW